MAVVDVSTLLAEGVAAHQAGQLQEAERRYRRVLTAQPEQPDALHLLAIALLQSGRAPDARTFARRATSAAPAQPTFWNTRGAVEQAAGRRGRRTRTTDGGRSLAWAGLGPAWRAGPRRRRTGRGRDAAGAGRRPA